VRVRGEEPAWQLLAEGAYFDTLMVIFGVLTTALAPSRVRVFFDVVTTRLDHGLYAPYAGVGTGAQLFF